MLGRKPAVSRTDADADANRGDDDCRTRVMPAVRSTNPSGLRLAENGSLDLKLSAESPVSRDFTPFNAQKRILR